MSRNLLSDRPPVRYESIASDDDETDKEDEWLPLVPSVLPLWDIICILSMAFSYGCIMTTLFLITLPVECERIDQEHPNVPKSVILGIFVAISGASNLITPLVGMLSDTYRPPKHFKLGQRMPYFVLGSLCSTSGLLGQYVESYEKLWLRYGFFYFATMIGLNISYAMMLALIPDQVPKSQTGTANGILALLLVVGSLCGFGIFHEFFERRVQNMYGLYVCVVVVTTILTGIHAHDQDYKLNAQRGHIVVRPPGERRSKRRMVLGPLILLKTMLYDPVIQLDRKSLAATYSIDRVKHHDFFVVTVSRLFYYCGGSVQTVRGHRMERMIDDVVDD
jgi:MFS family permease